MKNIIDRIIIGLLVAFLAATIGYISIFLYILTPRLWQAYKDYQYYNMQPPPPEATEPGCYRRAPYACVNEHDEGYLDGYDIKNKNGAVIIKWPGADCMNRYGLCVHVGDACGWKPTPQLAKCWAHGVNSGNPLRFTQADCDNLSTRCKNDPKRDECIKDYQAYCKPFLINMKR